jgi:NAD(P)-dependent dehydrogenase (short-subunit alcohol dehydrogenase family)
MCRRRATSPVVIASVSAQHVQKEVLTYKAAATAEMRARRPRRPTMPSMGSIEHRLRDALSAASRASTRARRPAARPRLVALDLAKPEQAETAVASVEAELGGIDILVNDAVAWPGRAAPGDLFESMSLERVRASLEANLLGQYVLSQAAVARMRRNEGGRVVHVSTGLVEDGFPGSAPYTVPKAGLDGLARTISRELGVRRDLHQRRHGRLRAPRRRAPGDPGAGQPLGGDRSAHRGMGGGQPDRFPLLASQRPHHRRDHSR